MLLRRALPRAPPRRILSAARAAALAAALALLTGLVSPTAADTPEPAVTAGAAERAMRELVSSGWHPELGWSDFGALRSEIAAFYERRSWRAAWVEGGVPTPQALALAELLRDAAGRGLDPADYDGRDWPDRLRGLSDRARPGAESRIAARADVALTVSVARYATDLRDGRVDLARRQIAMAPPTEGARVPPAALLEVLANAADVATAVDALEPPFDAYRRARDALQRQLAEARSGGPGAAPASDAAARLELALERWRWLPRGLGQRLVVVNIPEYRLHAVDGASSLVLRVVVGRTLERHRTPVFVSEISGVQFRPWWNVPRRIAVDEVIPRIEKDAGVMAREGYELVDGQGRTLAATPEALHAAAAGALRLRQKPGPGNALGLLKLVMPNPHDVYLHATPAVSLFRRAKRDASHGCVRVEHPEQLAAWVLRDEPGGWAVERVEAAMRGDLTFLVPLTRKVPVLVVYLTATAAADGTVNLWPDVYRQDAPLRRALGERRASRRPVADGASVDVDEVGARVVADAAGSER